MKTVTIVGGGSSGWMTAAALSKLCPHLDITLAESPNINTIGVGESTLGHINKFLDLLGLKDTDWMKDCNATYKNSIRFTNFREGKGESFEYPFVAAYDLTNTCRGLQTWGALATMYPDEFPPETFAQMYASSNTALVKYNKQTKNTDRKLRHFDFHEDTAYHLDAGLFGQWLRDNIAVPNGVKHVYNEVVSPTFDDDGNLHQIICKDGQVLTSDLWIDCTGFRSQLLEQWMGSEFVSFSDYLANDTAWACPITYDDKELEMVNVTECTALDNGWCWNTPLWHRIGTGYTFSSKFVTSQDAKEEFKQYLTTRYGEVRAKAAIDQARLVNIKHGYRKKAFVKNVVGIGLSCGFVEPLESTGLWTTHENITKLVDMLNRRQGYLSRAEKDTFNEIVEEEIVGFRDFVSMHYCISQRSDTPYWKWCTQEVTNSFTSLRNISLHNIYTDRLQGYNFVLAGMGIKNISTQDMVLEPHGLARARHDFHKQQKFLEQFMELLPGHYEYLQSNIYN
jgi:2-polyprenyl-6-methoxyphenol hydroxylase-like FAD-dependent oxidoreductase